MKGPSRQKETPRAEWKGAGRLGWFMSKRRKPQHPHHVKVSSRGQSGEELWVCTWIKHVSDFFSRSRVGMPRMQKSRSVSLEPRGIKGLFFEAKRRSEYSLTRFAYCNFFFFYVAIFHSFCLRGPLNFFLLWILLQLRVTCVTDSESDFYSWLGKLCVAPIWPSTGDLKKKSAYWWLTGRDLDISYLLLKVWTRPLIFENRTIRNIG